MRLGLLCILLAVLAFALALLLLVLDAGDRKLVDELALAGLLAFALAHVELGDRRPPAA